AQVLGVFSEIVRARLLYWERDLLVSENWETLANATLDENSSNRMKRLIMQTPLALETIFMIQDACNLVEFKV
ncbi:hypothetical protein GBA52_013417, partial [Prunus armeniaca]